MAYYPGLPHLFPRTCSEAVLGYQKRKLKSSQYETIETVIKRSASGNEDPVDIYMRHLTETLTKESLEVQDLALSCARMFIEDITQGTGPASLAAYPFLNEPKLRTSFAYELAPVHFAINITTHPESFKQAIKDEWYNHIMMQAWQGASGYTVKSLRCEAHVMLRMSDLEEEILETDGGKYDVRLVTLMSSTMATYSMARIRVMQIYGQDSLIRLTANEEWIGAPEFERELQKETGQAVIRCQERELRFSRLRAAQSRGT